MNNNISKLKNNIINIFGEKGNKWLNNLPSIIGELITHWQLTSVTPVSNMTFNYVAKANTPKYAVILKISCDEKSIIKEKNALEYFYGKASVKIIDYHPTYFALLLEQAIPGITLKSLYPSQLEFVMDNYIKTMRKLHQTNKNNLPHFPHIKDWLTALDKVQSDKIPSHLLKISIQLKNQLLDSITNEIVLHGDLHHDNILKNNNHWIAIATINEEKITNDAKWDGLHAVISNQPECDSSIYDSYRRLWVIEESFRINKHTLKMRPIYHFTPQRIQAHILLCYMVFTLIRHLQFRLQSANHHMSVNRIIDAVRDIQASILLDVTNNNKYRMLSPLTEDAAAIYKIFNIEQGLAVMALP